LSGCTVGYTHSTSVGEVIKRISDSRYEGVDLYTGAPRVRPDDHPEARVSAAKDLYFVSE
jgi:hypothetical protein